MQLEKAFLTFLICLMSSTISGTYSSDLLNVSTYTSKRENLQYLLKEEKYLAELADKEKNSQISSKLGEIQFLIGKLYFDGGDIERNSLEAAIWWTKASHYNNSQAQYNLGLMYGHGHGVEMNEEKAFEYFFKAANQNDPEAQFNIAYMYENGKGIDKNLQLAFKYYKQAADQGDIDALNNLASMYSKGEGIQKNLKKALKCWKKAAEQGDPAGQYNLGILYRHGVEDLGIKPDPNLAIKYFHEAAKQGSDMAQFFLGIMYDKGEGIEKNKEIAHIWYKKAALNKNALAPFMINEDRENLIPYIMGIGFEEGYIVKKDIRTSLEWYQKGAEKANPEALFALTQLYSDEKGTCKDERLAFRYCLEAAKKGHATAQYVAGSLYLGGKGTEKDYQESFKWLQKAAEQEDINAKFGLGISYFNGYGVEKDLKLAFKWLYEAAEENHIEAQYYLSSLYRSGKGVTKNINQSLEWLRKSADGGYSNSQFSLGETLLLGEGGRKNPEEAFKWFRKAASQSHLDAQYNLALMYDKGEGIGENKEIAFNLFYDAAMRGHINSQYNLAYMYYQGEGIQKNLQEAFRWCLQAAEQGDFDAQRMLGFIYKFGKGIPKSDVKATEWFIKAANQGCEASRLIMAGIYQHGEGTLKDKRKTIRYLNSIKDLNYREIISRSLIDLKFIQHSKKLEDEYNWVDRHVLFSSSFFENENRVIRNVLCKIFKNEKNNVTEWLAKYEKSAEQGETFLQINLSIMHKYGLGVTKDTAKASEWLIEAAQRENKQAEKILGITYKDNVLVSKEEQNEFSKNFEVIHLSSMNQIKQLLYFAPTWVHTLHTELGNLYTDGKISRPPHCGDQEVFSWLYAASSKGNIKAQYRLGRMYEYGWGIPKDKKAAFQCFKEGAEKGYIPSQKAVAEMYREGKVVEQSHKDALKWYGRAGKQGDAGASAAIKEMADENISAALYDLGRAHEEGWGIARDEDEAITLYNQAALQGYPQAQYAFSVKCLEGKASSREALDPIELLTTLSGEEARRSYLKFVGKSFNRKEKKKFKELQAEGLPEKGYYKAQHKLAELYETGKIFPLKTVNDQKKSYQEAIRLYESAEEAIHSGRRVILTPLDKVRTELKRLETINNEEAFELDHPGFKEFLEEQGSSKKFDNEFRTQLALIFNQTRKLENKEFIDPLLNQVIKLPTNSKMAWGALTGLESLIKSEEEINKETLSILSHRFSLMDPIWCLIPDPEEIELKNLKVAKWMLQDPRIDVFNSCFRGFEKEYYKDTFESSVKKVVSIFKKLHEPSCVNLLDKCFEYDLSPSIVNLEKLLTQKNDPTHRFAHRLVRISDIIHRKFDTAQLTRDFSALTALRIMLAHWAERGEGDCRTGGEDELNKFYLEEIVNTKGDNSVALTQEDWTLEMQVAISLAKFRLKLVDDLVTERDDDRIHAVKHLEQKVRVSLGLLGDAENYQDILESTSVSSKYLSMTAQDIINAVMQRYTPDRIAEHLANEFQHYQKDIHKGKTISNETHEKLYRRLRFQFLREAVAPGGNLDSSLFQDEDYLLDHCTKEDYERRTFLSKISQDWDSLKGQSFDKAREKREKFYDDYQLFTPRGAKALLYAMKYLEEEY